MKVSTIVKIRMVLILLGASACNSTPVTVIPAVSLDPKSAVHLFHCSSTDEDQERAVQNLEENIRQNFNWSTFWKLLDNENTLSCLKDHIRERILALHSRACDNRSFQAFAELAKKSQLGLSYLVPPLRQCSNAASESTVRFVLKEIDAQLNVLTDSVDSTRVGIYLSKFVSAEFAQDSNFSWQSYLKELSIKNWKRIVNDLSHSNSQLSASALVQLAEVHYAAYDRVEFLSDVLSSIVKDRKFLKMVLKRWDLKYLIHLLVLGKNELLQLPGEGEIDEILDQIKLAFQEQLITMRPSCVDAIQELQQFWSISWDLFLDIRQFERKVSVYHSTAHALSWLEDLHRLLERELLRDVELAVKFLDDFSSTYSQESSDVFWMRLRLQRRLNNENLNSNKIVSAGSLPLIPITSSMNLLDQTIALRMNAHVHPSSDQIKKFCTHLEKNGIESRRLDVSELEDQADELLQRGCVWIDGGLPQAEVYFNQDEWVMPFDTAVIAPDINFIWNTKLFDGSIFDLSTQYFHEDLAEELPPAEDGALVFPLLVGIKMNEPKFFRGPGTYYFLVHHVEKEAQVGKSALVQALNGFSGGNIKVNLSEQGVPNSASFFPTLVSNGSSGQKAVPRRKGGVKDTSIVEAVTYQRYQSKIRGLSTLSGSDRMDFLGNIPVWVMRRLIQDGEKGSGDSGQLKIHVHNDFSYLSDVQAAKLNQVCPDFTSNQSCMTDLIKRMFDAVEKQVEMARSDQEVLPILRTFIYEEPEGALGPENQDGLDGSNGELFWNQVEVEVR